MNTELMKRLLITMGAAVAGLILGFLLGSHVGTLMTKDWVILRDFTCFLLEVVFGGVGLYSFGKFAWKKTDYLEWW